MTATAARATCASFSHCVRAAESRKSPQNSDFYGHRTTYSEKAHCIKDSVLLDPACGTAGFLISAYKFILNNNKDVNGRITLTPDDKARLMQNFEGYDISQDMVRLSRVNMYLHHFSNPKIYEYDTLTSQDRWDDQFDVIFANPPFMTPKGGINPHNRFRVQAKRSEVLFVDYIAEHLAPNGRAGIIVPEGIVFKTETAYKDLRKFLVDDQYLYAVISLPAGVFNPYSGVKTSVLLFDKSITKNSDQILFVTVDNDGYGLGAQRKKIKMNDLPRTVELVNSFKNAISMNEQFSLSDEQKKYAILVKKEEIDDNFYSLVGSKYSSKNRKPLSSYVEKKLGELCSFMTGGTPKSSCKDFYFPAEVPWLVSGDINGSVIEKCDGYISKSGMENSNAKILPCNSVLIALNGQGKTRGTVSLLKMNGATCNQSIVSIMPNDTNKLMPEFLFAQLHSMYQEIRSITGDNQRSGLNIPILKDIRIIVPPIDIQQKLVAEIESYRKVIDGAKQVIQYYRSVVRANTSWKKVKLGEVCTYDRTGTNDLNLPYVGMEDIESNTGIISPNVLSCKNNIGTAGSYLFTHKHILYGRLRPYLNKVATPNFNGRCSTELIPILPSEKVNRIFLATILRSAEVVSFAMSKNIGARMPRTDMNALKNFEIYLPPIEIQNDLADQINREIEIVNGNRQLIELLEKKILFTINSIWNCETNNNVVPFLQSDSEMRFAARNCSDKFIEAVREHRDGESDE